MPIRLQQHLSGFRRDRRGNVAIIFAITAIPLVSAIGCAVDYSSATRMKAKMQTAADAAGIGRVYAVVNPDKLRRWHPSPGDGAASERP